MNSSIKQEKEKLREVMFARRKSLNHKEKRKHDKDICESLKKIILIKSPQVIHSYLPIKGEIDITPLLKWSMEKGIKVVCPKVLPKRQMSNLELISFKEIEVGPFRTIHPAGGIEYDGIIDLIILPGLAFDNSFNRLGYGGGYYDRFLVKHPDAYKVAVLYSFQLIESVPVEDHDVKMDQLIHASL